MKEKDVFEINDNNNCSVKAIQEATEISYIDAHDLLHKFADRQYQRGLQSLKYAGSLHGIKAGNYILSLCYIDEDYGSSFARSIIQGYAEISFITLDLLLKKTKTTVGTFLKYVKNDRYIVFISGHVIAITQKSVIKEKYLDQNVVHAYICINSQ
jgi:hypothetical protein